MNKTGNIYFILVGLLNNQMHEEKLNTITDDIFTKCQQ